MSHLFSSPKMPAPVVVQGANATPPTPTSASVQAASAALLRTEAEAQGARSTLLTGGQGATDPLTVQKKQLLGQ